MGERMTMDSGEDYKSTYDMMTPTDVYNEIYAGLQSLQTDRTLSDYLGHDSDYFIAEDAKQRPHQTRPIPFSQLLAPVVAIRFAHG